MVQVDFGGRNQCQRDHPFFPESLRRHALKRVFVILVTHIAVEIFCRQESVTARAATVSNFARLSDTSLQAL